MTFTRTSQRAETIDSSCAQVRVQPHQRLYRVTGWHPSQGLLEQEVQLMPDASGLRAALLPQDGDYHVLDPTSLHHMLDRYFRVSAGQLTLSGYDQMLREHQARTRISFGDVRAAVAQALQQPCDDVLGGRALRQSWREATKTLQAIADPQQQEIASHYMADHLDRLGERVLFPALSGTPRQASWAKKLRLRAMQRVGVLGQQTQEPVVMVKIMCARLFAKTRYEAGYWIEGRDQIQSGEVLSLLEAMLRD